MSFPRYSEYRDSGVEWLGQVPAHWEVKRLRFAADFNPSRAEVSDVNPDTDVSFLPMEAIAINGAAGVALEKQLSDVDSGYSYFRDGGVVVAKITPCFENGKGMLMKGLSNGIGFGTTELIVIRPRGFEALGAFLHYVFMSRQFREAGESNMYGAGGQKRVPDSFVRNFSAPLPPTGEQSSISAFLDRETAKIDALVAEQERLIELLKEKRQAVISHAVTKGLNPDAPMKPSGIEWLGDVPAHWEIKKLVYLLAESPRNGLSPEIGGDGQTPTFSTAAVRNGIVDIEKHVKFAAVGPAVAEPYLVERGDILVLRGSGSKEVVGTAGIVPTDPPEGCIYPDILIRVRPNGLMLPRYLVECLNCRAIRPQMEVAAQTAAGIWKISGASLKNLWLPVPPVHEQVAIQRHCESGLAAMDRLTLEAQRAIDLLQERRTALISAAVTGQIDVRHLAGGAA